MKHYQLSHNSVNKISGNILHILNAQNYDTFVLNILRLIIDFIAKKKINL